ncbi:MAG: response regulator transcription factor, partial [Chloroflexota bacterium]
MNQIVIAAPSATMRAGLRTLLTQDNQFIVAAELVTITDYNDSSANADFLLLTEDALGEEALADLADLAEVQEAPFSILLLTDDPQRARFLVSLPLRSWGVLPMDASEDELLTAIQAISLGLVVGQPEMLENFLAQAVPASLANEAYVDELTEREMEVLDLLAEGLANKQIALELGISEHTVKFHVSSVYSKIGATNRTEAVRIGARL